MLEEKYRNDPARFLMGTIILVIYPDFQLYTPEGVSLASLARQ